MFRLANTRDPQPMKQMPSFSLSVVAKLPHLYSQRRSTVKSNCGWLTLRLNPPVSKLLWDPRRHRCKTIRMLIAPQRNQRTATAFVLSFNSMIPEIGHWVSCHLRFVCTWFFFYSKHKGYKNANCNDSQSTRRSNLILSYLPFIELKYRCNWL